MAKATILTVDDDVAVSQAIARDLRRRYGADYRIVRSMSGAEALTTLTELALRGRPVALIASDQRMPGMTGIELLERSRQHAPEAKLVLLTAYADTEVAIKAINDIGLDHYLLKPWDPPEERLYPVLDDLLGDWQRAHADDTVDVRVVGHRWSDRSHDVKTFLARNHVPYLWLDVERDAEARRLQELAGAGVADLPLVLLAEGGVLRAPSNRAVAEAVGLRTVAEQPLYDLCIVGAGPAGLAAAVYAASEGLQTVVIEREAPGGQAGQSAAIENYLGFPRGLSGDDLTHRAVAQTRRFGAEMVLASDVVGFEVRGPVRGVCLADGATIEARSVLVATGVSYRKLEAPGLAGLAGRGVYYGATASEASQCKGDDVYVVGAANSAGQAALNLSAFAQRVVMLVRADSLEQSMSSYLVERIHATDNVEVRLQTEVSAGRGDGHLEALSVLDRVSGVEEEVATNWLFVFIGASPHTDWLGPDIARDRKGFVITGQDLLTAREQPLWPLARAPLGLETSVPGVFAAGDVRLDSMKRVASAVGEGAMSVHLVHQYLADDLMQPDDLRPLFLFDGLADEDLAELAGAGEEVRFVGGDVLFEQGKPADFWWVLLDGKVELFRRAGREVSMVGAMDRPGVWAGGFRAWADAGYMATGRGAASGRMFHVPAEAFGQWARAVFPLGAHLIAGFFQTVRNIEAMAGQREALVALGTLAAGLAHEINNPASATARAVDALTETCDDLLSSLVRLAEHSMTADRFVAVDALRREIPVATASTDPLAVADREEELSDWLDGRGVEEAWRIAPALASAGVDVAWCERAAEVLTGDTLEPGLAWVASTLSTTALLSEMKESTSRVSELVGAVKSYSQMDRASVQVIDVSEGIESTLVILGHKLRDGVTVVRDFGPDVPRIEANPGELNQVWTNLIDNAVDAMDGRGTLRLTTRPDGGSVVVEVADTGPGMPPDIQAHAFEPFFTTKDVGKGTGLGLDISRRIVVERHGGEITIESRPGDTVVRVRLPADHAAGTATAP